ncbi:multiple sugar transport system permease protein [Actinomyces ruminicola]|uniref:Multiple sugar transport system permease protein n=2 Tax=Actinomyces ruminicola TaxID=332524 RepID=A0A1G9RRX5_9ACTO|nr:multiple sugar transport system permease protein [Actinomyces ruminicola]
MAHMSTGLIPSLNGRSRTRRDAGRAGARAAAARFAPGQAKAGLLLVAPAMLITTVFFFIPMVLSLWWSFTEYNGIAAPRFVGADNYADLVTDPLFVKSAVNTGLFALATMTTGPLLGLLSALLLNRARALQSLFRAAFFLPVTMSLVVVASMWKMLLNEHGVINQLLELMGLHGASWLNNPKTALIAVAVTSVWQGFGFETVVFLAALQSVPRELYEAAAVDGAGPWRRFWAVTFPALRPTMLFVFVVGIIGAFQVFDQVFVMTQGGPVSATTTVVYFVVKRFEELDLGHASAAAYLLAMFLAVASAVQMRIERRNDK